MRPGRDEARLRLRRLGIVSVLTRGDLPAESGDPTGEAERSVLGGQEAAEAIVPLEGLKVGKGCWSRCWTRRS